MLNEGERNMAKHIELIDDYIVSCDDPDYQYSDNHGRLVRCRDCAYADEYCHCENVMFYNGPDDYCSRGKPKEDP